MKRVYFLSTCNTCQRIMAQVPGIERFEQIDIKQQNISEEDLDKAAKVAGSYEGVFSKRARKFRAQGLHEQTLQEADYKSLILNEYTFLKRPVFFLDDQVYIGNSKKVVNQLIEDVTGA